MTKKEDENVAKTGEDVNDELPASHFTETDLQTEWAAFLEEIRRRDTVMFSAINGFKFSKFDEDTITVKYPSEIAKAEFDKVAGDFFNHFKRKVSHFKIKVEYQMDTALKVEVLTKRKIFEKMAEINPLLRDLDDFFKFDFS